MWNWLRKSAELPEDKQDLNLLSAQLAKVAGDDFLSANKKHLMKGEMFEAIDWLSESAQVENKLETKLSGGIAALTEVKFLSNHKRKMIYDSVMAQVDAERQPWRWAFRSWRASVASLMILLLVMTTFVIAPVDFRVTRASKWTFLEDVQGKVFVNRDGKIMSVNKDFALEEGDLIFTGLASFVTIRYLDDSVTRLGESTSMEIKKLYVRPDNAVKTEVELSLTSGQIWASVYNLIDSESTFIVETDNARADVNNKAAFELTSDDNSTVLTVFDNVVDVSKKSGSINNIQPVIAGFKAEIKDQPVMIASVPTDVVIEKNDDQDNQWVITNLDLDKQHQAKLKEENLQFATSAVASDNALGLIADFKDKTKSLFAHADIEAARQRFLDVQLGIIKTQELLGKGVYKDSRHQANPLLIQYKTALTEIMADFDRLHGEDAGQADNLLAKMKEEVGLQRKALSLVMPGEKLYTVKVVVNDAGLVLARGSAERATYLLDDARGRLLEMQTLIAKDDLKGAEASFRTYLRGLDELVAEVEKSAVAEIEGSLFALLQDQIKQFKQLAAIESELNDKSYVRLADLVGAVKADSAKKLVDIIKYYRKNGIPFETDLELQNTIQEYFADSEIKEAMLSDLETILANYPEYQQLEAQQMNHSSAEGKKQDDDITVIIKDQPSSADVEVGKAVDVIAKIQTALTVVTEYHGQDQARGCRSECDKQ